MKYRPSSIAWILCLLAGISVFGIYAAQNTTPQPDKSTVAFSGFMGGPFRLKDNNGHQVTEKSWNGKYLLLYFGFTHCPDVCPTGLNKIAQTLNKLPADKLKKLQPLFVTVDPARDTAEDLKNYVALFHPKLIGLTGSEAQIENIKSVYKVYAQKQGDGPDYMVNHSAFTYLQDPYGRVIGLYSHETTAEEMDVQITQSIK